MVLRLDFVFSSKVQVTLATHTANGITEYDVNFASFAEQQTLNK